MKNRKTNRETELVSKICESVEMDAEGSPRDETIRLRAIQAARSSSDASEESFGPDWDGIMASAEDHKAQFGYYPWEVESVIPETEQLRLAEEGAQRFEREQACIRKFKRKHGMTPDEWQHLQAMRACPSYRQIVLQRAGADATRLLCIEDLARILKVGVKTIRNKLGHGTFPIKAHKIMGKTRFFAADVIEYLRDERERMGELKEDCNASQTRHSSQW